MIESSANGRVEHAAVLAAGIEPVEFGQHRVLDRCLRGGRQEVAVHRDLTLARLPVDVGRCRPGLECRDVVERHTAEP